MNRLTTNQLKVILSFVLCIGLGLIFGSAIINYWPSLKQLVAPSPFVYFTSNETLTSHYDKAQIMPLNWTSLLPKKEQALISRYQQAPPAQNLEDMTAQVLRTINASTDKSYQDALMSTNTVKWFDNQIVSISGFIVPIDFYENKSAQNIFLVPYFGACLHFPAPPPNQMIFIQLEAGFTDLDITQAYTFTGQINLELFEDPMGTSAYTLDVVSIMPFNGQPDDFRRH